MAFEQRDNTGSLFVNDKKETANHPDSTGTALIDGVAYWVSCWVKERPNGEKWRSLAFKRKEERAKEIRKGSASLDDTIPF